MRMLQTSKTRHILFNLVLITALILSGCSTQDAQPTPVPTLVTEPTESTGAPSVKTTLDGMEIGFVNWGNASEYQIAQSEWFKQFAEAEGAKVTVMDGKIDPATQVKALDDLIAAGVDGIVVQAVDPVATAPSIKAAREAGITVMHIGGLPDPSAVVPAGGVFNDEVLAREAARNAAAWLQENKPGEKAKVVLFDVPSVIVCHEWRMVAFLDEITKQMGEENVEVVFNDFVDHNLETVVSKMEDLIQSGADFNIFSACGGTGAIGGLDAMKAAGKGIADNGVPQDVWVLSIDATPAELDYLVDPASSLVNTIALTPKNNAKVFLDNFKKMLSGEIGLDEDFVAPAPGIMLNKSDGCQVISDKLADQYSIVPGYAALKCEK